MPFSLNDKALVCSMQELAEIPQGKVLINTINQHSYNVAQKDELFAEALRNGDYLIPDGMSIVKAAKWLKVRTQPRERIAGRDLFLFEMERLNAANNSGKQHEAHRPKVFFMGSSEQVLAKIKERAAKEYPNIDVMTYSPPYKQEFTDEDDCAMINAINAANPDLLWIGMTAPKQEKWAYQHWEELNIHCHCGTIGAVFDFYAGQKTEAPLWWQKHGLEWLYRLKSEPRRMFSRYVIGIPKFFYYIVKEFQWFEMV